MEELISFDMIPTYTDVDVYRIENLKINPNLELVKCKVKYKDKKYKVAILWGYIVFYRCGWFNTTETMFILESTSTHHKSRLELAKELLTLCEDELRGYVTREEEQKNKIKDWRDNAEIKRFAI